jgi:hypothetical protein
VGSDTEAPPPIRDWSKMYRPLDQRVLEGFGGVSEYGITVRWDKNFLKLARLLVERRAQFAMMGGVRFGGTLTAQDAFALGFDHIALAAGAGKPTVVDMPNGLARGVRTASDFLMGLQLTGAARADSIANLQVRLPIVVVGGGLTAIDTATESLAYYPVQVEKFLARYETLAAERGAEAVRAASSAPFAIASARAWPNSSSSTSRGVRSSAKRIPSSSAFSTSSWFKVYEGLSMRRLRYAIVEPPHDCSSSRMRGSRPSSAARSRSARIASACMRNSSATSFSSSFHALRTDATPRSATRVS